MSNYIHVYRLTIRIRSDDTIRPNTNTLHEANTKRIFGTSLVIMLLCLPCLDWYWTSLWQLRVVMLLYLIQHFTAYCSAEKTGLICLVADGLSWGCAQQFLTDFIALEYFVFCRVMTIMT